MSFLVDTHSHLYGSQFDEDRAEVILRADEAGVKYHFLPNVDLGTISQLQKIIVDFPGKCFPMLGLHPCDVKENYEQVIAELARQIPNSDKLFGVPVCAIGEIGLDYYWDLTFKEQQISALKRQISLALEHDLPIVLHTRNSVSDTIDVVENMHNGNLSGVFHCFGGIVEEAKRVIAMPNFYLGIGGVVTYKNSSMAEVVKEIPLDYILLETDAPYLSPAPFRGKRNEPSYMRYTAEKVAEIKDISLEDVMEMTSRNAGRLYRVTLL